MARMRAMGADEITVATTVRLTLEDRNWIAQKGLQASALLRAKIHELRVKEDEAAVADWAGKAPVPPPGSLISRPPLDLDPPGHPETKEERLSFIAWRDAHPERSKDPYPEKVKAWRSSLPSPTE